MKHDVALNLIKLTIIIA